jgi:hypothetical protein
MAGFVKRSSAQRWNRAAGIVEAAGAGSHFVRGIYRQPMRPGSVCEDLGDLQPGSYRGIAGATTAPGETGPVIVTGCDGDVTIDAVNHSGCTFYLGDLITANVDPCCVAHFTGCSCCGSEPTVPDCCERSIVICIAGERQILAVDGGTYTWDVSECCDCEGATLEVTLTCEAGSGQGPGNGPGPGGNSTISAAWEYTCGESTSSGTVDIATLCNDDADVEILGELDGICDGKLNDRWANFAEDCEPCETFESPCPDCNVITTLGTSFSFSAFYEDIFDWDDNSITISRSSIQTNDIYTITFNVSKETNQNSDGFFVTVFLDQSQVLTTSFLDQDGNVPPGATPTILYNGVVTPCVDPCDCTQSVRWDVTLNAESSYVFTVRAAFIRCSSPTTGYITVQKQDLGSTTNSVSIWSDDCEECP